MSRQGPPKHQNRFTWDPEAFKKKNETEVGGKLRPYSEITGVCPKCRDQIQWKRKYGKYKALIEPSKCQRCKKRNVRQAYHSLCTGCAKEHNVCAKCSCHVARIMGRDCTEVEAEKKELEEAIKNARERDRRTLIRAMNKGKTPKINEEEEEEEEEEPLPAASLDRSSELSKGDADDEEEEEEEEEEEPLPAASLDRSSELSKGDADEDEDEEKEKEDDRDDNDDDRRDV